MHGNGGALATIAVAHAAAASRTSSASKYHFIERSWTTRPFRRVGQRLGAPLFLDGHVVLSDVRGWGSSWTRRSAAGVLGSGQSLFD